MLINLLPDFFALLDSSDPAAAYHRYFDAHRRLLEAYWLNYVIEPVGPHFEDIIQSTEQLLIAATSGRCSSVRMS